MISKSLVKELEAIVDKGLEDSLLPYKKGNSIRIRNIVIRHNDRKGYLIYNIETNSQVARTHFKSSAIAIAKNLAAGNDRCVDKVLLLEGHLLKHYNDAIFYKNTMKKTNDEQVKEIRQNRLDIAIESSKSIRKKIDQFIFSI